MTNKFTKTFPLIHITGGLKRGQYGYMINTDRGIVYLPDISDGHDGDMDIDFRMRYNLFPNKFWYIDKDWWEYTSKEEKYSLEKI